ncbi:MAG: HAD family hydrolase, partial [Fusobacterium sp.]
MTDLDGTFVNKSKEVTKTNRKAVNFLIEKGLEFVVASGRDYTSIKDIT